MESQRAVPDSVSPPWLAGLLVLGVIFVLTGLPGTAFAAKGSLVDCDELASDLRSLDVPAEELPLDGVDHMPTDDADLLPAALESDAASPVLLLTPRVADLMQEVFNSLPGDEADSAADADDEQAARSPAVNATEQPAEVSPETPSMPNFQREMYRTDI